MRLEEGAGKIDAQGREGFLSTSGEQLVGQCRPIVHEADGVGVSHGDAHEFEGSPRRIEAQMPHIGRTIGRAGVRRGIDGHEHGIPDGRAHVHGRPGHLPLRIHGKGDRARAGQGVGHKAARGNVRQLAIDEVLGEAAHAVAAHLSQGAVGVDVVHVAVSLFRESRPHEDDAVGADAEVAGAQIRHLLVGQIKSAVAIVDEDEIVPETVQFGEGQLHGTLLLGGN